MGHAFRGYIHRTSSDHDGEVTIVFKAPSQYYGELTAIGSLTKQLLYVTVLTEDEVLRNSEGRGDSDEN